MIRIDYQMLSDASRADVVDADLVRKAQGFFGRGARQEILRILDSHLRVQAVEIAQRQIDPILLYEVGRRAVLDAIESYHREGQGDFRKFADPFIRQAMFNTKMKRL